MSHKFNYQEVDLTPVEAAFLGLLQGLTEFLPVSSSGHLVLGKTFLGIQETGINFEVFVHFGTLLAVVVAFSPDVVKLIKAFFSIFTPTFYKTGIRRVFETSEYFRLLVYLVIGTIPAAFIGVFFEEKIEAAFNSPILTCFMLIATGFILLVTRFTKNKNSPNSTGKSFLIGCAQAFAILPGISRSGSTISIALFRGMDGKQAARFSFLLALPAILGATILKSSALIATPPSSAELVSLLIGTLVSFVSGYYAIIWLLNIVRRGKLYWFAPYCFLLGGIGLLLLS